MEFATNSTVSNLEQDSSSHKSNSPPVISWVGISKLKSIVSVGGFGPTSAETIDLAGRINIRKRMIVHAMGGFRMNTLYIDKWRESLKALHLLPLGSVSSGAPPRRSAHTEENGGLERNPALLHKKA